MTWQGCRIRVNVEDRRRLGDPGLAVNRALGRLVILVLLMRLGGDPPEVVQSLPQSGIDAWHDLLRCRQDQRLLVQRLGTGL